ncbi:MAG: phosphatase PAP2 family protein [Chlamydiales bacterium]
MPHLPFHQEQLEFVTRLAGQRSELLDPFFRFLNYFDTPYFFFVLIPAVWLGISYQWGLRIFYWFTLNSLIINFAKNSIGWPRPSTDLPAIGLYHPSSFGFPSGGALICMFLGGLLIYYWRTRAAWVIGSLYIFLVSFSRLYLGVHYPLDILGGWIIAWVMLVLFITLNDRIEGWIAKKGLYFTLLLSLAIPLAVMIAFPLPSVYFVMGSTIGIGLGAYFSLQYHLFLPAPKNLSEGIGRAFIGVAILFLIVLLLPGEKSFLKSLVSGLFMSLAASPIVRSMTRTTS